MKFNIKKEKRCQYFSPDNASTALFSNALNKHIAYLNKKYEDLVLLCIGTDKITGDCLGPLVGSKLMQQNFPHPLYGTLEKPLHAGNLTRQLPEISTAHPNACTLAIDALENEDAFYQFENYSLKKQRGYYIYYETNQEMKNYMLAEGEMGHIPEQKERGRYSETIKRDTAVVRNYKKALKKKKNLRPKSVFRSPVYIGCGFAAALVFVYGIHTLAQFQGDDKTQTVFDQQKITDMKADSEEGKTESNTQAGSNEDTAVAKEKKTLQSSSWQSSEDTGASSDTNADNEETQTESSEETQETWNSIGGYYTVKRGDTLAAISKKMYHSYNYIEKIAEANGIENVDEIYPGQILELPQIED